MNCCQRIAVVLLLVLTGLPAAGAVCAMTCLSASTAMASHHGVAERCDEGASLPTTPQVGALSEHDCRTHDAAVIEMATTPAHRADAVITGPAATDEAVHFAFVPRTSSTCTFAYAPPPATVPPTTTPLVLRV